MTINRVQAIASTELPMKLLYLKELLECVVSAIKELPAVFPQDQQSTFVSKNFHIARGNVVNAKLCVFNEIFSNLYRIRATVDSPHGGMFRL